MASRGIVYAEWNPDRFKFFLGLMLLLATIVNMYVRKRYGNIIALRDVTMSVEAGRVTCVLGGQRRGQVDPDQDHRRPARAHGRDSPGRRRGEDLQLSAAGADAGVATVYQDLAVVPLMPVWRNFFLGSELTTGFGPFTRLDVPRMKETTKQGLADMGIDLRDVDQSIGTLSGGERQCVAIARAVHFGAKVLILDEPTAALGVKQSGVVLRYLLQARERGLGVVFITHNPHHAYPVGDRFLLLERGMSIGYYEKQEITVGNLTAQMAGGAELEELTHELEQLGGHTSRMKQIQARHGRRRDRFPPGLAATPHQTPASARAPTGGAPPMTTHPVRIGLVGAGRIGAMHAGNLAALRTPDGAPAVRLGIADTVPQQAAAVAGRVGAEVLGSVQDLLDQGLDGLVVATGTAAHPELIRRGLAAGLPVFCEKPVALTVDEALPLLEEIDRSQGVVQIGHQRRFDPGYLRARELFAAGELGWLHTVRAVTGDMTPPPVEFLATSGGLFRDCSVHDVDVLRWITGREVVEVFARGSNNGDPRIGEVGDVDTALAVLTFDDGTVATVSATRYNGAGHDVRLELQGSKGSVAVGMDDHMAMRSAEPGVGFPPGPPHTTFHERFAEAYRREMEAFVRLVHGQIPNPCTARDAVAASRVADAAQRALETGAVVALRPLPGAAAADPGARR